MFKLALSPIRLPKSAPDYVETTYILEFGDIKMNLSILVINILSQPVYSNWH